jgi:hypothetical protein
LIRSACLGVFLGLFSAVAASDQLGNRLTVDELRTIATARRQQVHGLRVDFTTHQEPLGGAAPASGNIRSIWRSMIIDCEGGRYRMERRIELDNGVDVKPARFAYDGTTESSLLVAAEVGALDNKPSMDYAREARVLNMLMICAPQPGGSGLDDGSLESFLQIGALREEFEEINGRQCYVVDALLEGVRFATVWLDPERDFLPMKRVIIGKNGGEASSFTVTSAVRVAGRGREGVWFPEGWDVQLNFAGQSLRSYIESDIESVVLNPQTDAGTFSPPFPPGTTVADRIAGMIYRVPGPGEELEILSENLGPAPKRKRPPRPERGPLAAVPAPAVPGRVAPNGNMAVRPIERAEEPGSEPPAQPASTANPPAGAPIQAEGAPLSSEVPAPETSAYSPSVHSNRQTLEVPRKRERPQTAPVVVGAYQQENVGPAPNAPATDKWLWIGAGTLALAAVALGSCAVWYKHS